jgi:hypothetical protein
MYEIDGVQVTEDHLLNKAKKLGISLEEYLINNPSITKVEEQLPVSDNKVEPLNSDEVNSLDLYVQNMKSSDSKPVRLPSFQEEEDFEAAKTKDNFQSTIDNVDNAVASADQALDMFPSWMQDIVNSDGETTTKSDINNSVKNNVSLLQSGEPAKEPAKQETPSTLNDILGQFYTEEEVQENLPDLALPLEAEAVESTNLYDIINKGEEVEVLSDSEKVDVNASVNWENVADYETAMDQYNSLKYDIVNNDQTTGEEKLLKLNELEAPNSMIDYGNTRVIRPEFRKDFELKLKPVTGVNLSGDLSFDPTDEQRQAASDAQGNTELFTLKDLDTNFDDAIQSSINENDIIQGRMLSYMEIFKPLIEEKKNSLQKKYAMTDPISLNAANEELMAYQNGLLENALAGDKSVQTQVDALIEAGGVVYGEKLKELDRAQSDFYSSIDRSKYDIRKTFGDGILGDAISLMPRALEATASWRDLKSRTTTGLADWWDGQMQNVFDPDVIDEEGNTRYDNLPTNTLQESLKNLKEGKDVHGRDAYVQQTGERAGQIATWEKIDGELQYDTRENQIAKIESLLAKRSEPALKRRNERMAIERWADLAQKANYDLDEIGIGDVVTGFVESLPYMAAAGGAAVVEVASGGTATPALLTLIGALGTVANTTAFFADEYDKGIRNAMEEQGLDPNDPQAYTEAVLSNKYHNTATNFASAGTQSLLERLGTAGLFKGFAAGFGKTGRQGIKSIYGDGMKTWIKSQPQRGLILGRTSVVEGGTEVGQQLTSDIAQAFNMNEYGNPFKYTNGKILQDNFVAGASIGLFTAGGGYVSGQTAAEVRNITRDLAVKFDWNGRIKETAIAFQKQEQKIKDMYEAGTLTEKEYQEETEALSTIRNAALGTPKGFRAPAKEASIDLLIERKKLQNKIESQDDAFTGPAKDRVKEINQELAKIEIVESALQNQSGVSKALDTEFIEAATDQEVQEGLIARGYLDKRVTELLNDPKRKGKNKLTEEQAIEQAQNEIEEASKQRGFNFQDENVIFLNKDRISKSGAYFTGAHEILHQILKKTLAKNDNSAKVLANALDKKLKSIKTSKLTGKDGAKLAAFYKRLEAYKNDPKITADKKAEEVVTLFSEALEYGQIKFDRKFLENTGDMFRRAAQNLAPETMGKLNFESAEDVYRFIKGFNKSLKKGKLTKAQKQAAEKGIDISDKLVADLDKDVDLVEQSGERAVDAAFGLGMDFAKDETLDNMMKNNEDPYFMAEEFRKDMEYLADKTYGPNSNQDEVIKDKYAINRDALIDELVFDSQTNQGVNYLVKSYLKKKKDGTLDKIDKKDLAKIKQKNPNTKLKVGDDITMGMFVGGTRAGMPVKIFNIGARVLGIKNVDTGPIKTKKDFSQEKEGPSLRKTMGLYTSKEIDKMRTDIESEKAKKGVGPNVLKDLDKQLEEVSVLEELSNTKVKKGPYKGLTYGQVTEKIYDKAKQQIVKGALISPTEVVNFLEQEFRRKNLGLVDEVKALMGAPASVEYENFLKEQGPKIYDKLKQRQVNKRFKEFKTPDIDPETGIQRRASTDESTAAGSRIKDKYAGNRQFKKLDFDEDAWVDYHLRPKTGRPASKQTALAEATAEIIGFDAAQEVLADPEVVEKFEEAGKAEQLQDVVAQVADQMNREVGFDFAKDEEGGPLNLSELTPEQFENQADILIDVLERDGYKDDNGNITKAMRDALMEVDPSVAQMMTNLFEENTGLFGKDGFQNILKESDRVSQDIKDRIKDRSLLLFRKGNIVEGVADAFAANTLALKGIIDSDVLINLDKDLNILGFKYGILDPAKLKKKTGEPGRYFGEFTKAKNISKADKKLLKKMGLNPKDIIAMNKDASKLKKILNDIWSQESVEGKLKALQRNKLTIDKANVANIKAFKYIAYKMQEGVRNRTIDANYAYQLLQAQTNIVKGFRALSGFEYVYLVDGKQTLPATRFSNKGALKVEQVGSPEWDSYMDKLNDVAEYTDRFNIHKKRFSEEGIEGSELDYRAARQAYADLIPKGEHLGPNANTMAELFENIENGTLNESVLDNMLADHTQFFGPTYLMDVMDSKGIEFGPKTARTSKEGLYRLTKFLPPKYRKNVYSITGQDATTYIAKEIEFQKALQQLNKKQREAVSEDSKELNEYAGSLQSFSKDMSMEEVLSKAITLDKALEIARDPNAPVKKIRVFDFDDTLATSNNIVSATRGEETIELNAEEFAKDGKRLMDEGWDMNFDDFNRVTDGGKGPLFSLAEKIRDARGTEEVYVLTARAPQAQGAIYEFLKSQGLEIPLKNITGLGNSTGAAKANWIIDKAAEGYNDFYFADDAIQNVEAVRDALEVVDVKSKVQQAKFSFAKDVDSDFNKIIEQKTGIAADKVYEAAKAKMAGASKGKFKFFIPPSAEDFVGLIYPLLGKGKLGDAQMAWFDKHLLKPYARAMSNMSTARLNLMEDFKALKKELDVPAELKKEAVDGFTNEQAVRVYIWNNLGYDVPGLSKTDQQELYDIVATNDKLRTFGDKIIQISKDGYVKPTNDWTVGNITSDLLEGLNTIKRQELLKEYNDNVDLIFSEKNLNKLEAAFGQKYREAIENMLSRMKSGKNRTSQGSRLSNKILDYINGSNAAIMFFNTRSAILQTISSINFMNWSFNNPIQAGKAFANQPQYWKDFMTLMNSDFLKDRRNGTRIDVSSNEIADAAKTAKNKAKAAMAYVLEKGYLPTQYADSFAIAAGGATWYRNRINSLMKEDPNMSESEASAIALEGWREISEESQQSSRPDKISQQQASDYGRLILMFANTPMQYARLQKRAVQDLANGRGDAKTNISKIAYYGVVQSIIFNALQQAMFAMGMGDEEEDEKRVSKTLNGMLDSQLRGLGIGGATISVAKNFLLDIYERSGRSRPEYVDAAWKLFQFSPPIGSKISKIRQALWLMNSKKRRQEVFDKGFSLDNPAYESAAKVISATTNIPLDRLFMKFNNVSAALEDDNEAWQTIAMLGGWPSWSIKPDPNKYKTKKKKEIKPKKKSTPDPKIEKLKKIQSKKTTDKTTRRMNLLKNL